MGQDRYPLPDHAAYIWTDGNRICLTFPGYKGTEDRNFNTVFLNPFEGVPCKAKHGDDETCGEKPKYGSLEIIWSILVARANAKTEEDRKIGSKAAPVQYDLEKVQRYMKGSGKAAKQDISHLSIEDMMKELDL